MASTPTKLINLALQGGGAHGAYTWGVLEHLLQDGRLSFRTISGTSAGSMNAAVMASGFLGSGVDGALKLLEKFWRRVSEAGRYGIFSGSNAMEQMSGTAGLMAARAYAGFEMLSRMMSPYQLNPLGFNPLREILENLVDFERLQKSRELVLHISATNVLTSRLKIFTGKEITVEALLASACLPHVFQAVQIGEDYYWDGGFMGNPTLYPLTECQASRDILIVQIDPIRRETLPKRAEDIADRINEISFNSPLLAELRGLARINRMLEKGHLKEAECGKRVLHLHRVSDEKTMSELPLESKFNPEWNFLNLLRQTGQHSAREWLAKHFDAVGQKSSFDVERLTG